MKKTYKALTSAHWQLSGNRYYCSHCNIPRPTYAPYYFNYCPNCGAKMTESLSELDALETYLNDNNYEYQRIDSKINNTPRHQIIVYKNNKIAWDAICHPGSYGYEKGLLEIYGDITPNDDVIGYLTAEDVIEYLKKYEET